jgi:hypothetical protein
MKRTCQSMVSVRTSEYLSKTSAYKLNPIQRTRITSRSTAIKAKIWPVLKQAGFSAFTSRVAWRFCADRIEVIEFQSFNSYNASIIGVTTFSFSVNIGMFPLYVPPQWPPKVKDGKLLPSQAECPFRGSLERSIQSEIKTTAIWPVNADGNNLGWCIQDVLSQLPNAFNWFANLSSKERVLQVLTSEITSRSRARAVSKNWQKKS